MLRDSRRDLKKMGNALQRDLGRLQKDLTKTAGTNVHAGAAAPTAGNTTRPKASAASR
ncbi:MAG: hypothetical protein ACXVW5_21320 [Solirubrobacteraceae bacterium]